MKFKIKKSVPFHQKETIPEYDYATHGVTQGILQSFLECREQCRLHLAGWQSRFGQMGLTYGSIVHDSLEIAYTGIRKGTFKQTPDRKQTSAIISRVEKDWKERVRVADNSTKQMISTSLMIAEQTLPVYFDYWRKDDSKVKWLQVEKEFCVPYVDYRGRKVLLRGKRDGAFKRENELWLLETKTKSHIAEGDLATVLPLDIQINLYMLTLGLELDKRINGALYNIIRRLCLKQNKKETTSAFVKRCAKDIESRPDFYFIRLEVAIDQSDLMEWEKNFLPLLTGFIDWVTCSGYHYYNSGHCINKYGKCKFVNICSFKDYTNYIKRTSMYNELEDL